MIYSQSAARLLTVFFLMLIIAASKEQFFVRSFRDTAKSKCGEQNLVLSSLEPVMFIKREKSSCHSIDSIDRINSIDTL